VKLPLSGDVDDERGWLEAPVSTVMVNVGAGAVLSAMNEKPIPAGGAGAVEAVVEPGASCPAGL